MSEESDEDWTKEWTYRLQPAKIVSARYPDPVLLRLLFFHEPAFLEIPLAPRSTGFKFIATLWCRITLSIHDGDIMQRSWSSKRRGRTWRTWLSTLSTSAFSLPSLPSSASSPPPLIWSQSSSTPQCASRSTGGSFRSTPAVSARTAHMGTYAEQTRRGTPRTWGSTWSCGCGVSPPCPTSKEPFIFPWTMSYKTSLFSSTTSRCLSSIVCQLEQWR